MKQNKYGIGSICKNAPHLNQQKDIYQALKSAVLCDTDLKIQQSFSEGEITYPRIIQEHFLETGVVVTH